MKTFGKFMVKPERKVSNTFLLTLKKSCTTHDPANFEKKNKSVTSEESNNTSSKLFNSEETIHMANVYKLQKLKREILKNISGQEKVKLSARKNEFNIQMLSDGLYNQIFRDDPKIKSESDLVNTTVNELKKHGLWEKHVELLKNVDFEIPPLKGRNIEEHFLAIGTEQSECYKNLALKIINKDIPKVPNFWLNQHGWTKYIPGKKPIKVMFPDEDVIVFDVEVCIKIGQLPTIATAVSPKAWYGWVSSDLCDGIDERPNQFYHIDDLIPFDNSEKSKRNSPRLIIGHNVSYDRARIKEEYHIESSALRFLDTMSLHVCIGGLTRNQKALLKNNADEIVEGWKMQSCLSSLKDVYQLYCKKELVKEKRSIFTEGTYTDVRKDFQSLMEYCANDVIATQEVLKEIFPIFLKRFPHPVTLAGMLEMSTAYLPITENWKKFLTEADQTYEDLKNEMSLILSKKSDNACRLFHNEKYKSDLWMWNENWSTQELKLTKKKLSKNKSDENIETFLQNGEEKEEREEMEKALANKFQYLFDLEHILPKNKPFLPGYPLWYRKLCEKAESIVQPTTGMLVTPKLLHLTWEKYPLHYIREFGWGILVADIYAQNVRTSLPFDKLKDLTLKNCNFESKSVLPPGTSIIDAKSGIKKLIRPFYYKGCGIWCNHTVDDCCYFFKLPHKDGGDKNVGNPLSKDFTQAFSKSFLVGSDTSASKIIDLGLKMTYWRNNRDRLYEQMPVWLNKKEISSRGDDDAIIGAILPKVVVSGTLTRRALENTWLTVSRVVENRIGSELRALIQAPPGYHLVGADVDSQELWIASLIGDSNAGKVHGATPLGWMMLSGTKANGTDMHSLTAKAIGISRDHAKIINYSRIYGAGLKFAQKLLQQFHPAMEEKEAFSKAKKMYDLTKGIRTYIVKDEIKPEFMSRFNALDVYNLPLAIKCSKIMGKKLDEVFERSQWVGGTESAMFNRLEEIASSYSPTTPFLSCRLSRALEPQFEGDQMYMNTRINWIVQSGAVDFLHLMLVCMRWLTNGQARYCFSFHDEIRYLIPSDQRYSGALAVHMTNLLVRAFCSHRLGMYDLPQSVAFFSSVEVDKILRKEADDDCITPSNPHGMEKGYGIPPGESLDIYETVRRTGGNLSAFLPESQVWLLPASYFGMPVTFDVIDSHEIRNFNIAPILIEFFRNLRDFKIFKIEF